MSAKQEAANAAWRARKAAYRHEAEKAIANRADERNYRQWQDAEAARQARESGQDPDDEARSITAWWAEP